jgi:hypothetical protein
MDIAALSVYMSQANLSQQVSIAVTKKVMDVSDENCQNMIKMLETSVNPNLGVNLDVRV